MSDHIRSTSLRFNLQKETHRRAWKYLQTMDKTQFKSYSHAVALAVDSYFERFYKSQDDPYLETREREERFITQIVSAVELAMEKSLPLFLSGYLAGITTTFPESKEDSTVSSDTDVDWDFLGG